MFNYQRVFTAALVLLVAHPSTNFHQFPHLDSAGTLVGLPTAELADVSSDDAPVWMSEEDQEKVDVEI